MKFEERLNELINEAKVPDELEPMNIAAMLRAEKARSSEKAGKKNIYSSASVSAQRRSIIMRTAAATAACAVFAAGMLTYNSRQEEQQQIEERVRYEAVSPESYDDLYNKYTDIYLHGDEDKTKNDGYGDDTVIGEEESGETSAGSAQPEVPDDIYEYDIDGLDISDADIVKCEGGYMYCLKDKTLYIVSLETMEVVSEIECKLDPPIGVYIEGGNIIIISTETGEKQTIDGVNVNAAADTPEAGIFPDGSDVPADDPYLTQPAQNDPGSSGQADPDDKAGQDIQNSENVSRTNTAVDIYNIRDPEAPVHTVSYRQDGSYTASRLVDGRLYTVTSYSDHRIRPLDEQTDLDSFVPAYYINGEKFFVDAADITIPANVGSTDYTVISVLDTGAEDPDPSVKAVLGPSRNVYCSADTLYIAGTDRNDPEQSIVSAFDLCADGIVYRAGASLKGTLLCRHGMNEYDGNFRIALKTADENGAEGISVYVLDRSLSVVNSAEQLFTGENITSVRFEGNYARSFESGENVSAAVADLSDVPPSIINSGIVSTSYLYSYSGNRLLGIGRAENGGMKLAMYDPETGDPVHEITFAENEKQLFSAAFDDKRAVLAVPQKGIIGIPVYSHTEFGTKNIFYVFDHSEESGFLLKGTIEYTDLDDRLIFERALINEDTLYVVSKGRIIAARLDDLKVIGVYEY